MKSLPPRPCATRRRRPSAVVAVLLAALMPMAGCGEKKREAGIAAARVDGDEISVQQINTVLQARNLRPDQADAAGRQVLERLIDQQLALRKALALELDRDPRVVQNLEAARREVLARAYLEKVGEAAAKPTAEEIDKYYEDKPALFSERRVYSLQEITIEARADQIPALRERLAATKNVNDFIDWLKTNDFRYAGTQAVRTAEQLPLASLDTISKMKDGQALLVPTPTGVQVVVLAGSRSQPVRLEQARPAIEQFIVNERRRKLVEDDVKALRKSATVEYLGRFADGARPAAGASTASGADGAQK
jgi:EpsD family peptidyl-prolyl cis-trans isomerase